MSAWLPRALIAAITIGCGSKPAPRAPDLLAPELAPQVVEEVPDLSAVAKPKEVVVAARFARPKLFFETVAGWASLPLRLEDILPSEARGLSQAILWDAPVDALVALDATGEGKVPPPLAVISVGLKSVEEALNQAEALRLPTLRIAPGIHRVGEWSELSCAVAASLGAAPARLVCGGSAKDLDALLPYATRGLPKEPQSGADAELSFDIAPLQERYGHDVAALRLAAGLAVRQVALDSPRFDRALSDAIYGGVDELINVFADLASLRLEARLDAPRKVLTLSTELRLRGQASWTAGTVAAITPSEIPASLPRLPPDVTSAVYHVALPAERYRAPTRLIGDLLDGYLEHHKLPAKTRQRLRQLPERLLSNLPEAFAFTVSPPRTSGDPLAYLAPDTNVTRVSEPAARLTAVLSDLEALLGDRSLRRWAKEQLLVEDKAWPRFNKKPLRLPGFKTPATVYDVSVDIAAITKLDMGWARAIENAMPRAGADGRAHWLLVVQPEGNATYLASGKDTAEIARVMSEHRKAGPGALFATPAGTGRIAAAGFATLGLVARRLEVMTKQPEVGVALAQAPHHGETPLPFASSVGAGSLRLDLELPAAAFADVAAAVLLVSPGLKDTLAQEPPGSAP